MPISRKQRKKKARHSEPKGRNPKGAFVSLAVLLLFSLLIWTARNSYEEVSARFGLLLSLSALTFCLPRAILSNNGRDQSYGERRRIAFLIGSLLMIVAGIVTAFADIDFAELSGRQSYRAHTLIVSGWLAMIFGGLTAAFLTYSEHKKERALRRKSKRDLRLDDDAETI